MTKNQTEYFIKTYESGSISTAAESLYVSRSAISYAISELENEFNTELFIRSNSGVKPTRAGKMLYDMLIKQEQEYLRLTKQLKQLRSKNKTNPLRIAIALTNTTEIIPVLFDGFMTSHPEIPISVAVLKAEEIPNLVAEGKYDAAITPSKLPVDSDLERIDLFKANTEIVVSQKSILADKTALTAEDVCALPLAFLQEPPRVIRDMIADYENKYKKEVRLIAKVNEWSIIKTLVQNDYAATSAPTNISKTWKGVVSIPVQGLDSEAVHRIIWNRGGMVSQELSEFINYIVDTFK